MSSLIQGNKIFVNGVEIPSCPYVKKGYSNVTVVGKHVYVNGYEYKKGEWKRTLKAIFHNIF